MEITAIILCPLIGFLINGIFGKKLPKSFHGPIATIAVGISFFFSCFVFYKLTKLDPSSRMISVEWWKWMSVGELNVSFKFIADSLSSVMLLIITGIGSLIHLYSISYMEEDKSTHRFFAYLNLFVFSMLILVLGSSLLTMFIGWEGVGLCSYLLIGFWFEDNANADAGKKAFITNRIGDLGFLLGTFTLFAVCGTLEFSEINEKIAAGGISQSIIYASCLLLFLGACGKSAQIPLYVWLPDAMAGPTPVSALIHAATMVTAGVFMIARLNGLFIASPEALQIILYVGAATAIFSATIGLVQNDIKKVLAYSTVSQLGFMFVAMGSGAFAVGVFHLMTHAFFKACLFLGSGSVIHANHHEQDMRKYGNLRKWMPWTFRTYLISTLAIAGFPLLSGFMSKDEILWYAFAHNAVNPMGAKIAYVATAIAALFTAIYMARSVAMTFFGDKFRGDHHVEEHLHESPFKMTFPLIVLGTLALVGGYLNVPPIIKEFGLNFGVGEGILHHWIAPSLSWGEAGFKTLNQSGFLNNPNAHSTEIILVLLSIVVGLLGLAIGFLGNLEGGFGKKVSAAFPKIHHLLLDKYRIDEFYQSSLLKPIWNFSVNVLHKICDVGIIDGFVNGVGQVGRVVSNQLMKLQSGNAHWYAFYLVCGMGAFLYLGLNF